MTGKHSQTDSFDSNATTLPPEELLQHHETSPTSTVHASASCVLNRVQASNPSIDHQRKKQLEVLQNVVKNQSREIVALRWSLFQLAERSVDKPVPNTHYKNQPIAKKTHVEQLVKLCDDARFWSINSSNVRLPFELESMPTSLTESESRLCALYNFIFENASAGSSLPDKISLRCVFDAIIEVVKLKPTRSLCDATKQFFERFLSLCMESCSDLPWLFAVMDDVFGPLFSHAKLKNWTEMYETMNNVCARGILNAADRLSSVHTSTGKRVLALEVSSALSRVIDKFTIANIPEDALRTIKQRNILFSIEIETAPGDLSP